MELKRSGGNVRSSATSKSDWGGGGEDCPSYTRAISLELTQRSKKRHIRSHSWRDVLSFPLCSRSAGRNRYEMQLRDHLTGWEWTKSGGHTPRHLIHPLHNATQALTNRNRCMRFFWRYNASCGVRSQIQLAGRSQLHAVSALSVM
jgi:hypothetical protein